MEAACTDDCTAFVVENGSVYASSRGDSGQPGLKSRQHQQLPVPVGSTEVHDGSPVDEGDMH